MKDLVGNTKKTIVIVTAAIILLLVIIQAIPLPHKTTVPCCIEGFDGWYFVALTESILDGGSISLYPPFLFSGEEVYHFQPPLYRYLVAKIAGITNLPVFFTAYYLSTILLLVAVIMMFLLIKKERKENARCSLPFFLLLLYAPFVYIFKEGQFSDIAGTALFVIALYRFHTLITKKEAVRKYFFSSLVLFTLLIGTHTEHIYVGVIICSYLGISWMRQKEKYYRNALFAMIGGAAGAVLLHLPLLVRQSLLHKSINQFYESYQITQLLSTSIYDWYGVLLAAGGVFFAIGVWLTAKAVWGAIREKKEMPVISYAMMVLLIMHAVLILIKHYRGFDTLQFFPLYFAPVFATGASKAAQWIGGERKKSHTWLAILLGVLFVIGIPLSTAGIGQTQKFTKGEWEGIEWIAKETPEDASVLYLYPLGEKTSTFYWAGKRRSYHGSFIEVLGSGKTLDEVEFQETKKNLDFGYVKKGFLQYEEKKSFLNKRLCEMDYIFLNAESSGATLCDPNLKAIPSQLMTDEKFSMAYGNEEVAIFANNERC